jgi:uncharacterized membrane protein YbhN (UPF0104 family)
MMEAAPSPARRGLRRYVTIAFYVLVAVLLAVFVARLDLGALARIELKLGYLAAAVVVGLGQRLLLPLVWVWIVRDLGVVVRNYPAYNFVYAKAWLGRYLPGKVAMVAARVYFADELGASRSAMVVSSMAEIGAQLLVGAAVGLIGIASLADAVPGIESYRPIAYGMVALLALGLVPPVFNGAMRLAFRIVRRPLDAEAHVRGPTMARALLGFLAFSVATGALAVLAGAAVDETVLRHPIFVWGAYSLAITMGMAFVLTPSGIGAREAVQLPLLTVILTPEAALAIVALCRAIEVAIDALFYGVSALWAQLHRAKQRRSTKP